MMDKQTAAAIRDVAAPYASPVARKSVVQLVTSFGGFLGTCACMYAAASISYWIVLALSPVAAGFLVRVFIIQHDCGHRSFFRSKRLNDVVGTACSLMTLAPYASWSRQHAGHHRMWNNLDERNSGADIYSSCLTTREYRDLSARAQFGYRAMRHPLVANILLPPLVFLILYRAPFDMPRSWKAERRAVLLTNLALVLIVCGLGLALGFGRVAVVQVPVMVIASIFGVWLFSVQHRGEWVSWHRRDVWTPAIASLESSTFLRLPRFLQWFTGNIGFHHVHHLRTRIPNYRLEECHLRLAALTRVREISLRDGLRALNLWLWDETAGRFVTFRAALAGEAGRAERSASA
jgi:omega-6 fatty acid desaturase (delta-12 desaturase)